MSANVFGDGQLRIVTPFGDVLVSQETIDEIMKYAESPTLNLDWRTRTGRLLTQFERDVYAIAEVEWVSGGDLEIV